MAVTAYTGVYFVLQGWTGAGYTTIAGQRDGTLNLNTAEIDVTCKDNPTWKQFIAGVRDWSIDFDGMLMIDSATGHIDSTVKAIQDAYMAQAAIAIQMTLPGPGAYYYQGSVIIGSLKIQGPVADVLKLTGTLKGTGTLTYTGS